MYLFSQTTLGFYPEIEKQKYIDAGTLPKDLIEVSAETRKIYNSLPPEGKKLGSDDSGLPFWEELSVLDLTEQNNQLRQQLRMFADSEIAWRKDAYDGGEALAEEIADLDSWKKYRVLLMRVDTAAPVWPVAPGTNTN